MLHLQLFIPITLMFAVSCGFSTILGQETSAEIIDASVNPSMVHHVTTGHFIYHLNNYPHYIGNQMAAPETPVLVQPYNIFDSIALCPAGYILAHNHCHKQVKHNI